MTTKVKTPYASTFSMPRACVVCGDPPVPGLTWKVSGAKSNWSGKQTTTLTLEFPLCQACHDVSREKSGAKWIRALGVLVAIVFCLVMAGVVGSGTFEEPILPVVIGLGLLLALGLTVQWLSNQVNVRDLTPEQRERRRRVQRCAKISGFKAPGLIFDKQGWILFNFENASFAAAFSGLNAGQTT
jgi:hypothetical protein